MEVNMYKLPSGAIVWGYPDKYNEGKIVFHNEGKPAVVYTNGKIEYFNHGLRHNSEGPAIVDGCVRHYYKYGKLHNDNGPAVLDCNSLEYYIEGNLERRRGPSVVEHCGCFHYVYKDSYMRFDDPDRKFPIAVEKCKNRAGFISCDGNLVFRSMNESDYKYYLSIQYQ
jgi:hypothetical protein